MNEDISNLTMLPMVMSVTGISLRRYIHLMCIQPQMPDDRLPVTTFVKHMW
jgi:hypothetical protein